MPSRRGRGGGGSHKTAGASSGVAKQTPASGSDGAFEAPPVAGGAFFPRRLEAREREGDSPPPAQ
eukprot:6886547-Alexandrium_andersonii.AAC.1